MKAPFIGITTCEAYLGSAYMSPRTITMVNQTYVELVTTLDAIPLLLSPATPEDLVAQTVSAIDGLILIGGQDIHPEFFGQDQKVEYRADVFGIGEPFKRSMDYKPCPRRDRFELLLYQEAKSKGVPIIGICRGLQLINVAEGGTLHQELLQEELLKHERGADGWIHHHMIYIDKSSKTFDILQEDHYPMSSLHHQGIDVLGKDLVPSARSKDGVIEIIEKIDDENFILGVHGHIEQTRQNLSLYDKLLYAFLDRARSPRKKGTKN